MERVESKEGDDDDDEDENDSDTDEEEVERLSFTLKQLIRKLHITEPVDSVMCLLGKKWDIGSVMNNLSVGFYVIENQLPKWAQNYHNLRQFQAHQVNIHNYLLEPIDLFQINCLLEPVDFFSCNISLIYTMNLPQFYGKLKISKL